MEEQVLDDAIELVCSGEYTLNELLEPLNVVSFIGV